MELDQGLRDWEMHILYPFLPLDVSPLYYLHQPHLVCKRQLNRAGSVGIKLILLPSSTICLQDSPPVLTNSLDKGEMLRKYHRKGLFVNFIM